MAGLFFSVLPFILGALCFVGVVQFVAFVARRWRKS